MTLNGFNLIAESVTPKSKALAQKARSLIYSVYPQAIEVAWPKQKVIGYGVGERKMSEHFVYLSVFQEHINIGFYYGAELADPYNLLKGEGKLLKHIRIESIEELDNPEIKKLVVAASKHLPKLDLNDSRIPQ